MTFTPEQITASAEAYVARMRDPEAEVEASAYGIAWEDLRQGMDFSIRFLYRLKPLPEPAPFWSCREDFPKEEMVWIKNGDNEFPIQGIAKDGFWLINIFHSWHWFTRNPDARWSPDRREWRECRREGK